ncbi:MAG: HEAT repeat domain-containing protein [Sorangiineae bacterium]|nr:HEAT repeat domain-containing protein [Sorangiineae bacterium]
MVRRGSPEVRAAAALALTRLGDYETVALAERWAEGPGPAALRVAGARILSLARAPGASTAIAALIGDPATASDGLALAEAASEPALLPVLERELARAPREQVPALLAALGRSGGERAAAVLERELARADRAPFAAYALALCPGEAAARALARALARPASRRLAARAAEVRALVLGEQVAGFREALAPPPASDAVADTLPTRALLAGVEEDELRAPIYAYALAVRDDATVRERVSELLASGDVMVRRATALGLAASARPDATGLLEDAYRFETDPLVRRALVTSLGSRGAGQRTLALAAALDGEAAVREAARRALGPRVAPPLDGRGVAWLVVEGPPRAVAGRRALVFPASGPPRAARADSDGLLVVTGLPPGPFEVRLAPRDDREHAPARSR